MRGYWLVKTEPHKYSWDNLSADGKTVWDGVRNYQARNNLRAMKKGDSVLVYHSGDERQVMGVAEVIREYYQDPTTKDNAWVVVDLKAGDALIHPVPLVLMKKDPKLGAMKMIKQSRLSVSPLTKEEYDEIVLLGQ